MPYQQRQFDALMERLRQGSQDAAWELVERYGTYVQRVVRRTLDDDLRPKFDSLDFIQSVWASFFRHREQLDKFAGPENLIAFLVTVAKNKVIDEKRRRLSTAKYNVRQERSLEDSEVFDSDALHDKGPRGSEVVIVRERWNTMMRQQPRHYRRIVEMRLAGSTFKEIGTALGVSERTARRVMDKLIEEHCG